MSKSITIETGLKVDYRDAGPWRSYWLTAHGRSEAQLIRNASITEIDQDGGELACYALEDAADHVGQAARKVISEVFQKARVA